ncbi:Transcriptional activator protein UGA3 [Sphaceloma murrayae]|uniref:Transcriptional activator protein UGA3 n=1 Tax=Sphaceloma murrayae TaxID=2082308 RepID=A0A2K1QT24_9PEZI|nr:Transcriptional activator protein UGA3 [Sphaceloma murrayae]
MELAQRSTPRSFSGCATCRRRKVKCDEKRPKCGPCTRLHRQCDWARQWRFVNSNYTVERQYVVTRRGDRVAGPASQPSSIAGPVDWSSELPTSSKPSSVSSRSESPFASSSSPGSASEREEHANAATPDPGAFVNSYIFTHHSQADPPNTREDATDPVENEDAVEEIATTAALTTPRQRRWTHDSHLPQLHFDFMDYGTRDRDNFRHPQLFDAVVCKKIMPLAVRFRLNVENNENLLLTTARRFRPLHHAICAITLLNSGLNNRPELLAGSFQHYDQAVSACRSMSTFDPEATFFLHFILLMYDIGCASQRWPQDRTSWAIHLQGLASLVHNPSTQAVSRLKAYLSWYILLLDAQAAQAGNEEAGCYLRAFLEHDCILPLWPIAPSAEKTFTSEDMYQTFLKVHRLSLLTFQLYAEQSQLSLDMRRSMAAGASDPDSRLQQIDALSRRHQQMWQLNCPSFTDDPDDAAALANQPLIIQSTFYFARLQYSVLSLYLHSSMYHNQRLECRNHTDTDAVHCSTILRTARATVASADTENHHLAPGLFIAGFVSRDPEERVEALELLRRMSLAGLSGAVRRVYRLLEMAIGEQDRVENEGGERESVDWIEWSRGMGGKHIVLGM